MEKEEKISRSDSLQIFLVKRIILAMIFIYLLVQVADYIRNAVAVPILTNILKVGDIPQTNESILSSINLLINVLLNVYSRNILLYAQYFFDNVLNIETSTTLVAPDFILACGDHMVNLYYIAVIEIILLQLFCSICPFIIAGWWYIRSINIKVEELRREDEERRKEIERKRNLLFSDIAHDIKTPITSIVGYSQALSDGVITDRGKQKEYLKSIYAKSMRIANLITLLFEFVKLDSDGFKLNKVKCDLAELVRNNVIALLTDFEEKDIDLDIDIPEEVCMVNADTVQMSRVVTNILSNAIRYIDKGNFVSIKMEEKDDNYVISIADNGLPIEEEFAKHIFEPFSRSDKARQTTSGGSGLGLSIAKKISQMHDGDLVLDLNYSEEFTKAFVITIPKLKEEVE